VRVWGSIGFIATVTGLGFLFDHIGLHWVPVIMALLIGALWLGTLLVGERDGANAPAPQRDPLLTVLRRPVVIAFFTVCFLLQFSHGPYYTFFSLFLERHGYSRGEIGLLWSLGVLAEVGLFLVMHRLLERFGTAPILLASLALAVLRWLLIGWCVASLPLLLFAQCLHAATFASYHACAVDTVRRLFAGGHEGQGMALYSGLSYGGGGAAGAVVSGMLWNWSPPFTFTLAAFAALVALVVAWRWLRI
jgi:PPP family 3-phenylpropionic acid transporter